VVSLLHKRSDEGVVGRIIPVFVLHPLILDVAVSQEVCGWGRYMCDCGLSIAPGLLSTYKLLVQEKEALRIRSVDFA
jgi:hypothetical protein